MTAPRRSLDDVPVNSFHKRVVAVAWGGPFCDGYILGIIAVAVPQLTGDLGLSGVETGLIAASAIIGVLLGGLIFGPLTDRVGRKIMYTLNLVVFILCSIPQFFVTEAWQLIALRLLIGIAIGADYPIVASLTSELVPRKMRGPALTGLLLGWWIGYAASFVAGWAMLSLGDHSWRWMLASAAAPAFVFLLMRAGIPESPLWLASRGRLQEAKDIVRKNVGPDAPTWELELEAGKGGSDSGFGLKKIIELFRRGYGMAVLFCATFWACQLAPAYAIRTFQPDILKQLDIGNQYANTVMLVCFALVGVGFGVLMINRIGRRLLLVGSFAITVMSLTVLGLIPHTVALLLLILLAIFQMSEGACSTLQFVYTSELFPTDLRATGIGIATALSRIGAALSTFAMPMALAGTSVNVILFVCAAISLVGLVVSIKLAPETKDMSLSESSRSSTRRIKSQQKQEIAE